MLVSSMRNQLSAECVLISPHLALPACLPALRAKLGPALMGSAIFSEDLLSLSEPRDAAGGHASLSTGGAAPWAKDEQDRIPFLLLFYKNKRRTLFWVFFYWRLVEEWSLFHFCCRKNEKVKKRIFFLSLSLLCSIPSLCPLLAGVVHLHKSL